MFRVARICILVIHASKGKLSRSRPQRYHAIAVKQMLLLSPWLHQLLLLFVGSLVVFLGLVGQTWGLALKISRWEHAAAWVMTEMIRTEWQKHFFECGGNMGIWRRGIRLLSLLDKIGARSQVNLILPFFIYYLRHEWQLNSFFDFLWHFGEVQSLAILSVGIFEHLVHSAHFWQCPTNRSHWKNLPVDRFFCKTNNILH